MCGSTVFSSWHLPWKNRRQTILGGYGFGVGSTLISFIILGNYSMGMQVTGKADFIAQYLKG